MKNIVARWWGPDFPYERFRNFGEVVFNLVILRRCVAGATLGIGLASLLSLATPAGPGGGVSALVVWAFVLPTVPIAVLWWRGPWPSERVSLAYVVYADLSLSIGLLMFSDPVVAMAATSSLAVVGLYVTLAHTPDVILAHVGVATSVSLVLCSRVISDGDDLALAICLELTVLAVVAVAPLMLHSAWTWLRSTAWSSLRDPLTGLLNRRGLPAVVGRLPRSGPREQLTLALIDLDQFKEVNDRHGHQAGDEVLRMVAARLEVVLAGGAHVARVGGDELVVATYTSEESVHSFGALLLSAIHDPRDRHPVTASIGIARAHGRPGTTEAGVRLEEILGRADGAMYLAKRQGRNQVVVDRRRYPVLVDQGSAG